MRRGSLDGPIGLALVAALVAATAGAGGADGAATEIPGWAFAVNPAAPAAGVGANPADDRPRGVPDSDRVFTRAGVSDRFSAPDWHPDGHPPMPEVVARGRKPGVYACGFCHLPNGQGRPENSSLAGLPASYIIAQVADFKSGLRHSSEPRHLPTDLMGQLAQHVDPADLAEAASYFASLRPHRWIRVEETDVVAKTRVAGWMLVESGEAGTEPIGERIIETPVDLERTELRDDASGFVAYVPRGSVGRGEALVRTGAAGRTVACGSCHGPQLKGLGVAPPLAGRSPSYLVRQLVDIQRGARRGEGSLLMQAPVARLTPTDMVSIAAYVASLEP